MNIFDIIIVLIVLMFGVVGLKNGVIKEGVSFIGTLLVFFISYAFKGVIGNVLCKILPFFAFSGNLEGLVSLNILIYQLIAFLIIFSILMVIYHIIFFASKILQKIIDFTLILTIPSKLAGAVVGLVKGYLVVFIVLLLLGLPLHSNSMFKESKCRDFILYRTPFVSSEIKDVTLSMEGISDLVIQIEDGSINKNEANLQIIDTMLKYDAVDYHTVEQLVVLDKLKTVKGIDEVINNYK